VEKVPGKKSKKSKSQKENGDRPEHVNLGKSAKQEREERK